MTNALPVFDPALHFATQLQHLSCFTALQSLELACNVLTAGHLSGLQHLSQLTDLKLYIPGLANSAPTVHAAGIAQHRYRAWTWTLRV